MSELVGELVFLDGFFGRVEARDGPSVVFLRIDDVSMPDKLDGAREHFAALHEAGEAFSGSGLWGNGEPVRVTAFRWEPDRHVVRIKVERVSV